MTTEHPDLELLSAFVDGLDESGTAAHVETCDACRSTLATLRRVSGAVAAPVEPPSAEDRESAIAAAVAAALADGEIAVITARPRRLPRWTLAVAATILLVAAAAPLISRLARNEGPTARSSTASSGAAPTARTETQSGAAAGTSATAVAPAGRTDLGRVDDTDTLRARLKSMFAAATPSARASGQAPSGTAAGGTAGSATAGPGTGDSLTTITTAPADRCATTAAVAVGASGTAPVRSADLVWQGTPAVLFVFVLPNGAVVASVVVPSTCGGLATISL